QQGFRDYQELALSRLGLRKLYGITLTLALLLAVFAAIAVALSLSKRLVRPLLRLAAGTQAVGVGDYRPLPEPPERDEVGQLTRSFNAMTRQLDEARHMVESNRRQLERSNVYLESVLSNLSSGVLVFDEGFRVTMVNQGAQSILQADLRSVIGRPLETVDGLLEFTQIVRQAFAQHAAVGSERLHWQQQFEIALAGSGDEPPQPLTLLARGTHLRVDGRGNGYLVVFDDISEVISANRTVDWREVALRRGAAAAAEPAGARHPPAGRRARQRLPGDVRRHLRTHLGHPHGGLGRGGAPAGAREQEPAHAHPAVGRAPGHEARRPPGAGRPADARARHQHHRQPGGVAQADGRRL